MQHQPWEEPRYVLWPLKGMNPFTHTLISLIFIESLLCTRHHAGGEGGSGDTELNKKKKSRAKCLFSWDLRSTNAIEAGNRDMGG